MKCRICGSRCIPVLETQGIYKCSFCASLNRAKIPNTQYYSDVKYWYTSDWLKLYQKSILTWFEQDLLNVPTLEVGAADGDMLALIQEKLPEQKTIYSELVNLIRPEYKFNEVWIGPIEKYTHRIQVLPPSNVILINLVEHLESPFSLLDFLPRGSRLFIVTDDGDSVFAFPALILHLEHSCIITKKAFDWVASRYNGRIVHYYPTPVGISITVLDI